MPGAEDAKVAGKIDEMAGATRWLGRKLPTVALSGSEASLGALLVWSMYYLFRRRQYEALIGRLERELVRLRNLPFVEPSPLEDLRETPDAGAAQVLVAIDDAIDADPAGDEPGGAR